MICVFGVKGYVLPSGLLFLEDQPSQFVFSWLLIAWYISLGYIIVLLIFPWNHLTLWFLYLNTNDLQKKKAYDFLPYILWTISFWWHSVLLIRFRCIRFILLSQDWDHSNVFLIQRDNCHRVNLKGFLEMRKYNFSESCFVT